MSGTNQIPIANLYYLLCYSWNRLDEDEFVDVSALRHQDLANLLATILASGVRRLLRQGMDRVYVASSIDVQSPRGKIDLAASIKSGLLLRNAVTCVVDDLHHDVLHNQIIRTTLNRLAATKEVERDLRHDLRSLDRTFDRVSYLRLRSDHFARVQLHRNNGFYRFLINVCELCFHSLIAEESSGQFRFVDFVRDEHQMRKVFQDFVFNFYRMRQREYKVTSQRFEWDFTEADDAARKFMPEMATDICLESPSRKIIIECKFTPNVLSEHWQKLSARSEHLYQLFSYLKNLEREGGASATSDGLLLYPTATNSVDMSVTIQGHKIRVVTLDLRLEWRKIECQLKHLLLPWNSVHPAALRCVS